MGSDRNHIVIRRHVGEFPEPMTLRRGDRVSVGALYDGAEGWPGWYLCAAPGQGTGYVPVQILDRHADGSATMLEDYTNRELDVMAGDVLRGGRRVNGWLWATRIADGAEGWVPLENLHSN